ncbi:MAG: gliding motility-associated C-terminal domain-containing protein [Saprospiraceae bacterium]|nr:gliding motility-associated C-terminal domain-containing protein [Saprospiraceae bacterium]
MNIFIRLLTLGLVCSFSSSLVAQNILISYTKSDSLFVCGADTFRVGIQNNQSTALTSATFSLNLPGGLLYLPGSIQGAVEQNISDPGSPVFSLPDIGSGQTVHLTFLIETNCIAADVLDAGQLFVAQLSVAAPTGNAQVTTTSIPVETGAVVIESVTEEVLEGEKFDTLQRTICFRNTRLGKIANLHFEDAHLPGIAIEVPGTSAQSNTPTLFSAAIETNLLQSVGNGDAWLDLNETLCIVEKIAITDCGIPSFTNPSTIRVGWGCGSEICRYDSAAAFIEIKPSTLVPELVFEQIWTPPVDYCGQTSVTMGYKINNIGRADATDIIFDLTLIEGLTEAAIVPNSIRLGTIGDTTPLVPNLSLSTFLPACGISAIRQASMLIPLVAAMDSASVLFDVITCVAPCGDVQPAFRTDYFYRKDCPINGFVSDNALIVPETGYVVKGELRSSLSSCLTCDQSYPFVYFVNSRYIGEDGFLHIELDLPKGISFDSSCGAQLGGYSPVLTEISPQTDGRSLVHLAWETPMAPDSLLMNFCLFYACDSMLECQTPGGGVIYTSDCCLLDMESRTFWTPLVNTSFDCAISDCDEQLLAVIPTDDGSGGGGVIFSGVDSLENEPYLRDWWNVYRLNLGYRDADDDRHAENLLSPLNPRRDRFLAGDTLRVEYCGVIDSMGGTVDTIVRAIWQEIVGSDMGQNDQDVFQTITAQNGFADAGKVRVIGARLRIRYADGTVVECDAGAPSYIEDKNYFQIVQPNAFPPTPIDDIATEKFYYLYSLPELFNQGCLPQPFMAYGDSIFVFTDFKLDVNFTPTSTNSPDPPLIGFRTASSSGGKEFAWNEQPRKYLQYSGWRRTLSPNTHSIKPCENSTEVRKFRYSIRIARENMFPFEVRPLAFISDYYQTLPPGLELANARVEYLTLQDSVPNLLNVALPFSQTPGFLHLDFSPAFLQPIDEGFTLRTGLQFKPNCLFNLPDTSRQYIETTFNGCLNGDQMVKLDSIKNPIGFFSNTPRLELLTGDTIVFSPTRDFEIAFTLNNQVVSNAPASWITVVSSSGLTHDFELFQMPQNQPVVGNDDFFNAGVLNGFSQKEFRLKGQSVSCLPDTLWLIYGWSCTPQNSPDESGCGRDSVRIILQLERPELELDVLQEPDNLTLCDTSDWFEFEIFNAKTGYAYELEASVKLPAGLRIAPGTCQVSYPAGAAYVNISDPATLPGNLFQWDAGEIQAQIAANGLPGVNLDPANAFRIRFKVIAECGAVLNTPIIYGTSGTEPCGRSANVLNKPGDPIQITGINPTYGVQISLLPVGNAAACGQNQEFSVSLNLLGTPSAGDSIYIILPQGVSLLLDSYAPGVNAPPGPVTPNTSGFQLPLPMLAGGGSLQFNFMVELGALAGCNDQVVRAQTLVRTEAFCETSGAPCAVYVATGEAIWNINPEHPQLSIIDAQLGISGGQVNGVFSVSNIGNLSANGVTLQIWRDIDGNGNLSAGDVLLETLTSGGVIPAGSGIQISGVLTSLDSTQLCNLLLVLPAAENCTCDDLILPLTSIQLTHTPLNYCNLDPVELGVPEEPGFNYAWSPLVGINCATCPNIIYTPGPNDAGITHTLTLTASTDNCEVTHQFTLSFADNFAVVNGEEEICKGASVTLNVGPPGVAYYWEGAGIQNPALAQQVIQPLAGGNYAVTVTFENGCTASDVFSVTVLQPDTLILADASTCEGEPVTILNTTTDVPGVYQLMLQNAAGCDSLLIQTLQVLPKIETVENLSFCAGDTLEILDTMITSSGEICRVYTAFNGCDSTYCVMATAVSPPEFTPLDTIIGTYGQIITLNGPDGYLTYIWEPAPVPPCLNCPSVSYPADSAGYQEYVLRVAGQDGCPGELVFRVFVLPPCSADSLRIPNAFSPNGDGSNDVFRVVAHEGSEVISGLEIYNRWGEKVYEGVGNAVWDGTIDGKPASSDVYVYIVKVTCGNLVGRRVGDVSLIR